MYKIAAKRLMIVASVLIVLYWLTSEFHPTRQPETTFAPDASFEGRLFVTVIDSKEMKFLLDVKHGLVSATPGKFEGPFSPGGIVNCIGRDAADIPAPSNELSAECFIDSGVDGVRLRSIHTGQTLREWRSKRGWGVRGLAWSPNSDSVAVLLEKDRLDLGPIGLVSASAGHLIQFSTFKVSWLSVQSGREVELPVVKRDSVSGWARIDWIQ
jgi:hypothetical protein